MKDISKKVTEKNLRYKKAFFKQLREFAEDDSYFNLYDVNDFKYSYYLVRLFRFNPPEEFAAKSKIYIPSNLDSNSFATSEFIHQSVTMPIAKIIKVGDGVKEGESYNVGDIVTLPSFKVLGWLDNPAYMKLLEMSNSNMTPINHMDIPPKIQALEVEYRMYGFIRLGNLFADEEDMLTYLLPASELKGRLNLDKL